MWWPAKMRSQLNWGLLRMGSVSFLLLFLLPFSSAVEERDHTACTAFNCEKLGYLQYPFNNETSPKCGVFEVVNCSEDTPQIRLEKGGRFFGVKNISQAQTMVIQDEMLQRNLKQGTCKYIENLTSSAFFVTLAPILTLTPIPNLSQLTMFKCQRNHSANLSTEYAYTSCRDFIIYYNHPNRTFHPPTLPPECSIVEYPVNMSLGLRNLSSLLTSDITLGVDWTCSYCRSRGGKCRFDKKGYPHCEHVKKGNNHRQLAVGLGTSVGIILFFVIFCLFIKQRCQKRKHTSKFRPRNDSSSTPGLEVTEAYFGIPVFRYSELEEATNYFDTDKEIGDGGFGTVYHGKLQDGREVAVKRLYENNYRRVEQFMNEVKILTRLRHPNLVSLYGCTSRRSRELLLVYEFVPNGTVADHLHGDRAISGSLTWPIRLNIAIETASALCYLHASDVIHRDVKTHNILLDSTFSVKVGDFGLSRLFPLDATHVSTAPQGTPGYVDPEYHQCYHLTEKSDVYSFGVVLIELVSSLPAVDISRNRSEINLSNYAINRIQKSAFQELIDPQLGFDSDPEVNRTTILVAELAFRCLQPDRELRPSMDKVLETLKEIESDKHESGSFGSSTTSKPQPPPSPDYDGARLLKSVPLMPSPDTVTAQWHSRSTTPCASA